ncbi:MAG: CoA transferase [Dehalococcoidia bacterium]|nr:CoA transferase [Dehalococcoidia bacterium]
MAEQPHHPESRGPLDGVRVLAATQIVAGPFAGVVLSDLGAEVVKLEPPQGEGYRNSGSVVPGESKRFQSLNRGSKSLAVDLASEDGRALVQRLVPGFDVFLTNYRPGVLRRMGLDYDTLAALNPGLVYCTISGFGEVGPWAGRGATDMVAQAYSGLLAMADKVGPDGEPQQASPAISDYTTALACTTSICAALYERKESGLGQRIDGVLIRSGLAIQDFYVMREPVTDAVLRDDMVARVNEIRARGGDYREVTEARSNARFAAAGPQRLYYTGYSASDGQIVLGCLTQATRDGARRVLGMTEDVTDDDGYDPNDPENAAKVVRWKAQIADLIQAQPVQYWLDAFIAEGVPVSPVHIPEEMSDDPQIEALGVMVDLEHPVTGPQRVVGPVTRLSRTPSRAQGPAPALAQHTAEVLRAAGVSDEEIAALRERGVVR